jgi:hypothetical protein
MGPMGPAGATGPAGPQGASGPGIVTSMIVSIPATQVVPQGYSVLGISSLNYTDAQGHKKTLTVAYIQKL